MLSIRREQGKNNLNSFTHVCVLRLLMSICTIYTGILFTLPRLFFFRGRKRLWAAHSMFFEGLVILVRTLEWGGGVELNSSKNSLC